MEDRITACYTVVHNYAGDVLEKICLVQCLWCDDTLEEGEAYMLHVEEKHSMDDMTEVEVQEHDCSCTGSMSDEDEDENTKFIVLSLLNDILSDI